MVRIDFIIQKISVFILFKPEKYQVGLRQPKEPATCSLFLLTDYCFCFQSWP